MKGMMKITRPLIVLDLETTGIWIEKDKIVEVGMIKCLPDGSKESYTKRVNPGIPIPANVTEVIGITNEDVKDKPFFKSLAQEVLDFIGEGDLAGFNLEKFDLPLLEREMVEAGLRFHWQSHKVYDAQKVYHLNEKRDLTAAYKFYCEKDLTNAHTAEGDAQATLEILTSQVERYGNGTASLEALDAYNYKSLADFYDEGRRFRWWNGELYPMFGKYAKRNSLRELVAKDQRYLEWILTKDFSDEVKQLVEDALKGQFPVYSGGMA